MDQERALSFNKPRAGTTKYSRSTLLSSRRRTATPTPTCLENRPRLPICSGYVMATFRVLTRDHYSQMPIDREDICARRDSKRPPVCSQDPFLTTAYRRILYAIPRHRSPLSAVSPLAPDCGPLNDLCGVVWHGGKCHLFYQQCAPSEGKGWTRATSSDLVHRLHLPLAGEPTPGAGDEGGCWSGSAGLADGRAVILYTGVEQPMTPAAWSRLEDGLSPRL